MGTPSDNGMTIDGLGRICIAYAIDVLYAFGSRAEEIYRALHESGRIDPDGASDVDLGAKPLPGHTLDVRAKAELAIDLENLLGVQSVDLVGIEDVDAFVAAEVIRGNRLYCADEYRADEYELYILRRAGDLAPFERERMRMILGGDPQEDRT